MICLNTRARDPTRRLVAAWILATRVASPKQVTVISSLSSSVLTHHYYHSCVPMLRYCLGWTCNSLPTNRSSVMYRRSCSPVSPTSYICPDLQARGRRQFCQHEERTPFFLKHPLGLREETDWNGGCRPRPCGDVWRRGRGEVCRSRFKRGAVELTHMICRPGSTGRFKKKFPR